MKWLRQRVRPTPVNHRTHLRVCKDPDTGATVLKRDDFGRFIPWKVSWDWAKTELNYTTTYELTKRGRLHINLICWPWVPIPQIELQRKWGARVWVAWVNDNEPIGVETAKAYTPESLGGYLVKLEQAVPKEWGRRVSFSKKWPKVPPDPSVVRAGRIVWLQEWEMPEGMLANFVREKTEGQWHEITRGEWEHVIGRGVSCVCFDWVDAPTGPDIGDSIWFNSRGDPRSDGPAWPWKPRLEAVVNGFEDTLIR